MGMIADKPKYNPVKKNSASTPAEKFLGQLCEKTFLSLWSYPCVYRKDRNIPKEVCDLLVIFGDHIFIFSDKDCELQETENVGLDWQRWFRRAIWGAAEQAWGAERWIKQNPSGLYLDKGYTQPLPIKLPDITSAKFHLIVATHGVSDRIKKQFGSTGTGSLMIDSALQGLEGHKRPFTVGDLDPNKTFIHVFDEESLLTVMRARDTVSDFIAYLEKRERLLRGPKGIFAAGEEELLAIYLKSLNERGEHDFVFPGRDPEKVDRFALLEGGWEEFQRNPQRTKQLEEDKVSYMWDALIETFSHHALRGESYYVSSGGLSDTERILQFMAKEPRFKRRFYSQILKNMLEVTANDRRRLRVMTPTESGEPYYAFLLFPLPPSFISNEDYRKIRGEFLQACCMVVKLKYPDAEDIIGIATESGLKNVSRSEDAVYLNARQWNDELQKEAEELHEKLGILKTPTISKSHIREYPDIQPPKKLKNPRNKKCYCGSGKKYKKCHGK